MAINLDNPTPVAVQDIAAPLAVVAVQNVTTPYGSIVTPGATVIAPAQVIEPVVSTPDVQEPLLIPTPLNLDLPLVPPSSTLLTD